MKILDLRKRIVINLVGSAVLLVMFGFAAFYNHHQSVEIEEQVGKINMETGRLRNQRSDIANRFQETQKYKGIWNGVSDIKKQTSSIKMDETNAKLSKLTDKYTIIKPVIKVTLPEALKDGIFSRKTIAVSYANVTLSFSALSDVKAMLFVDEFIKSLPGYIIITNIDIRKNKNYSTQDLIAITSGSAGGGVLGKVEFIWYAYKDLEEEATTSQDSKKQDKAKR